MRVKALAMAMALLIGLGGVPESFAQKKKAPAKKPAASATKAPARKSTRRTARRRTGSRPAQAARRAPAPTNQRVPSKDRYAEIQQALADAGHFTGEANGVWNQESIEAMKAFQAAQGFEPTGKVDSRSLIKLGLGPKYDTVSSDSSSVPSDPRQPG
jgi:peptidoglycan hydrolase-like protein with peptidoglycan-binding domain